MARWNCLGAMILATSVACGGTQVNGGASGTTGTTTSGTVSLPAGSPCSSNGQCFSQICGVDGTGNCCTSMCSTDGSACGIAACDETGACIKAYAGTSCDSCSGSTLTLGACNGSGTCEPGIPSPCPGALVCNDAGTACDTTCATSSDCGTGFYCNAGACAPTIATGACTENAACASGVCGINGTGHCCSAACSNVTPPCGATDCADLTGGCVFPSATVSCGSTQESCSGSTQSNPSLCDGMGNCPTPGTTECSPFICGANACLASCTDATSCGTGDFCDLTASACCAPLASGATLSVDALVGSDELGCCGIGDNPPCKTLTHAMQLIDMTQASNVTIQATVGDGGGDGGVDWAPAGEKYPIVLGWGVELNAPGVYFWDPNGPGSPGTFLIDAYSLNDTIGYASIVGTSAKQIGVGMSTADATQSVAYAAIQVDPDQTLYIANAYLNGSASAQTDAITVMPGGSLVFGQDRSAAIVGTVNIGNGNNNPATDGYDGVFCRTDNSSRGCTVTDTALPAGQSSVVIQGQEAGDIVTQDFASITLTSAPSFGVLPGFLGFGYCSWKPDGADLKYNPSAAIYLNGESSMTLKNAAIHCISGDGIALAASQHGNPTLVMDGTTIRNTETALQVGAGTATVWNSTFEFNFNGVIQAAGLFGAGGGTVNLNGGLDGGTDGGTTVICSSNIESIYGTFGLPGVSVENQAATPLNAENVTWDTAAPDQFHCKTNLMSCYCSLDAGACALPAGTDGMDAVTENGPVIVAGNMQSALVAQHGCHQ